MLKAYEYRKCSTCRDALKWLELKKIKHEISAIRETPPSVAELKEMLKAKGDLKKLFNTSGQDYKALGDERQTSENERSRRFEVVVNKRKPGETAFYSRERYRFGWFQERRVGI